MRQAGLKPKSHSRGVYWVRANGSTKRGKGKQEEIDHDEDYHFLDKDRDGIVSFWEAAEFIVTWCGVIFVFGFLIWLELS